MSVRAGAFLSVAGALLLVAATATAQRQPTAGDLGEARAAFTEGQHAFSAGDYTTALVRFRRVFELTDDADVLFNVGQSADRLRLDREALDAFEGYLERRPDASDRPTVEGRIRVIRAQLIERARAEEEARRAPLEATPGSGERDESPSVLERWWFWAILGAVVAGAVVGIAVAAGSSSAEPPEPGTGGVIFVTLRAP